jgi:peptidoglycan/LPS O-acetylase OafA/YrhL
MKLSNFTQGRDNNFNLIRIVAAFAVLISHSFALAVGTSDAEPFRDRLGMTTGSIAVDVFFITSGFLVTASLLGRKSVIEFIWARVLRIFPALLIMLLLTVFVLGVFFTSLPKLLYLTNYETYHYLVKNMILITGIDLNLPGVFNGNPYHSPVNQSLWTLPYEISMYTILAVVWVVLGIAKKVRFRIFEVAIITFAVVAGVSDVFHDVHINVVHSPERFSFMFFSGAAFYVLKEHITLSRSFFWLSVIALGLSTMVNKQAFYVVYTLTIAYILFYIAYIPSGGVRKYNQLGDYSYGVYIYAFPVQQSVAALIPGVSVLSMLSISAFATLLLAVLSWHLLERRALGLKGLYVGHTRRILSYGKKDASTRTC